MNLDHSTDEELMTMYQNGNEQAFQVIYTRHSGRIFAYIQSKVRDSEIAGDLFQDTFVKIHKSKALYNRDYALLPWIFTITRNCIIDGLRKRKMNQLSESSDFEKMTETVLPEANGLEELSQKIMQLPNTQRQALEMRYLNESSFEEIAERLNTSSENVRQLVSRGVKNLKKIFGKERL